MHVTGPESQNSQAVGCTISEKGSFSQAVGPSYALPHKVYSLPSAETKCTDPSFDLAYLLMINFPKPNVKGKRRSFQRPLDPLVSNLLWRY
jgi:hypothetical protein